MARENAQSFMSSIRICLEQVDRLKKIADPIVDRIKNGDLKEDFLERVRGFLIEFDSVRDAFDQLPLKDGSRQSG